MSIVIVAFEGAPKISEEAIRKEEELDRKLEDKVKGRCLSPKIRYDNLELRMCYAILPPSN